MTTTGPGSLHAEDRFRPRYYREYPGAAWVFGFLRIG